MLSILTGNHYDNNHRNSRYSVSWSVCVCVCVGLLLPAGQYLGLQMRFITHKICTYTKCFLVSWILVTVDIIISSKMCVIVELLALPRTLRSHILCVCAIWINQGIIAVHGDTLTRLLPRCSRQIVPWKVWAMPVWHKKNIWGWIFFFSH